jgi:hypothetical protein
MNADQKDKQRTREHLKAVARKIDIRQQQHLRSARFITENIPLTLLPRFQNQRFALSIALAGGLAALSYIIGSATTPEITPGIQSAAYMFYPIIVLPIAYFVGYSSLVPRFLALFEPYLDHIREAGADYLAPWAEAYREAEQSLQD